MEWVLAPAFPSLSISGLLALSGLLTLYHSTQLPEVKSPNFDRSDEKLRKNHRRVEKLLPAPSVIPTLFLLIFNLHIFFFRTLKIQIETFDGELFLTMHVWQSCD